MCHNNLGLSERCFCVWHIGVAPSQRLVFWCLSSHRSRPPCSMLFINSPPILTLSQVISTIAASPLAVRVCAKVEESRTVLATSITSLKEYTAATTASVPKHPRVEHAMEALQDAVRALQTLATTVKTDATESLTASLTLARTCALEAVDSAKTYLQVCAHVCVRVGSRLSFCLLTVDVV